jgi:hypothetical protein
VDYREHHHRVPAETEKDLIGEREGPDRPGLAANTGIAPGVLQYASEAFFDFCLELGAQTGLLGLVPEEGLQHIALG